MASTMAAALEAASGAEFDVAVGLEMVQPPPGSVPDDVDQAFQRFDYRGHIRRVTRMLTGRFRGDRDLAEEAVQAALLELYESRQELFSRRPETWMGLLYKAALHQKAKIVKRITAVDSIEGLATAAGDAPFKGARPVIAPALEGVDEDARYTPPPAPGERWGRLQMTGAAQRYRDQFGRPPTADECSRTALRVPLGLPPASSIEREFGSFSAYLLEAGMVPRTLGVSKAWKAVPAAKACLYFKRRNGHWPGRPEIERSANGLPGRAACERFFGGCTSAEVQIGSEMILAAKLDLRLD